MTNEEIATTKALLAKLQPGFLPLDIFHEIARLTVMSAIEVVPLRMRGSTIEVLLTERGAYDVYWPNQLHTPGSVLRATDEKGSYASAFNRILADELASVELAGRPQYVTSSFHTGKRGVTDVKVFFVEVCGEPPIGAFYDVDKLPTNTVASQIAFIHDAARDFGASKL